MSKKKGSSGVFNVLAFNFDGRKTARKTVKDLKEAGAFKGTHILAEIIVEQDKEGIVRVRETGQGGVGAVAGGVAGGLLSLIGGPVGFLAWVAGGAAIGGLAGKYLGRPFKVGDLRELGQIMTPNTSAFLLLVEDTYTESVMKKMKGVSANVMTFTVGDELTGELSQYTTGEVTVEADADTGGKK